MLFKLEKLPYELILVLVSHLDNYSILALLEVLPWLKEHAILITDHHFPPLFTAIGGLQRRCLPSHCPHNHDRFPVYDPAIDTQPIKLIECMYLPYLPMLQREYVFLKSSAPGILDPDQLLLLDSCSFVFVAGGSNSCFTRLLERIDEFGKGSKWVLQHPYLYTGVSESMGCPVGEDCPESLPEPCAINSLDSLSSVTSLHLNNRTEVTGLHLPSLICLTVVFPASMKVPELSHLHMPSLTRLVVHYRSMLPVMNNIHVIGPKREPHSIFDLLDLCAPLPSSNVDYQELDEIIEKSDYSFLKIFSAVNLSGVPNHLLESMDLSYVQQLRLTLSLIGDRPLLNPLKVPKLLVLWVAAIVPGVCFPVIGSFVCLLYNSVMMPNPALVNMSLLLAAPDVDISPLMSNLESIHIVDDLSIYRSPRLITGETRDEDLQLMTLKQWRMFFRHGLLTLGEMNLTGFDMSFLFDSPNHRVPRLETNFSLLELRVRPSVTEKMLGKGSFRVSRGFVAHRPRTQLNLHPILVGSTSTLSLLDQLV